MRFPNTHGKHTRDDEQPKEFNLSQWIQRLARWLSRRDYTQAEVSERLTKAGLDAHHQALVLERARTLGWLADERVAASTVAYKGLQWGKRRLVYHMKERGIAPPLIEEALSDHNDAKEYAVALTVWQKKFRGQPPSTPQETQKQMRFLASRGFSMDVIRRVIAHRGEDELFFEDDDA